MGVSSTTVNTILVLLHIVGTTGNVVVVVTSVSVLGPPADGGAVLPEQEGDAAAGETDEGQQC